MRFAKLLLLFMAVMVLFTPVMLSAQMVAPEDICKQAKMDARKDVNGCIWFGIGCFGGFPTGWPLLPMMIAPSPPTERLIGMPPEYIAYYTQCYKKTGKKIQSSNALTGCIISTGIVLGYYITAFLLMALMWGD